MTLLATSGICQVYCHALAVTTDGRLTMAGGGTSAFPWIKAPGVAVPSS